MTDNALGMESLGLRVNVPRAMTIAGSDSGGGAGIQADLKTFTALSVFGTSAVATLTAQNTTAVAGIHDLPPDFIAQQIDVVLEDIGTDAVKTGMLSSAAIVEAVADRLAHHHAPNVVVDPVMVAKSGDRLLQQDAVKAATTKLLPLSLILTPNAPELEVLSGIEVKSESDAKEAAKRVHGMGAKYVLVKGGHLEAKEGAEYAVDYLFDGEEFEEFSAPRFPTKNTHGTGCTYSSAIAAYLARGETPLDAVRKAKRYLTEAIRRSFNLGEGHGPLNHFWPFDAV